MQLCQKEWRSKNNTGIDKEEKKLAGPLAKKELIKYVIYIYIYIGTKIIKYFINYIAYCNTSILIYNLSRSIIVQYVTISMLRIVYL